MRCAAGQKWPCVPVAVRTYLRSASAVISRRLARVERERPFAVHVLACLQRGHRDRMVQARADHDRHDVESGSAMSAR